MGTTSEKLTYLSGTKDNLKTVINAMGGEIDDDTFRSYPETLNDLVLKSINDEIDLYDEYPKKQSTGTSITIDGIEEGKALIELNPSELSQDGTPTPDNPIAIKKVTGNNSITVCGKNLFDKSNVVTGYINVDGSISSNNAYVTTDYISIDSSSQYSKTATNSPRIKLYDENKNLLDTSSYSDISSFSNQGTYTIPNVNAKYIRFTIRVETGFTDINTVMFVKGSILPSSYEPYQSQTYPINLGTIELCKIGNYSDEFYLDNGNWYLKRNIGKVILDGTEDWSYATNNNILYLFFTGYLIASGRTTICSHYKSAYNATSSSGAYNNGNNTSCLYIGSNPANNRIYIRDDNFTNADDFEDWLTTHNVTLYYILATPTSEAITNITVIEQLNNLYNQIKSYKGQTNITQTNAELPLEITISALKELDI